MGRPNSSLSSKSHQHPEFSERRYNATVFQSVPNCAEAVIRSVYGGKQIANVLGFHHNASYDQNAIDDLAERVDDWWGSEFRPLLDAGYTYSQTDVRGLTNENDFFATNATNSGVGGVAGIGSPNNVAYVVTHRTNFTGRSARGRTYHAGIPGASLASTTAVVAGFKTAIDSAWATLPTYLTGSLWEFVVISRYQGGALRPLGITFDVVSSAARNLLIDSQRGRLANDH